MILKIRMNSFFKFIMRRKKVIFITAIVSTLLFLAASVLFEKDDSTSTGPKEEVKTSYNSEFSMIIENEASGNALINLNTLKATLIADTTRQLLEEDGVDLTDVDLSGSITMFIRSTTGEYVYVRVKNEDQELVTKLSNSLFKLMVEQKISFYENKQISVKSKPSALLTEVRAYGDYYSATDASLLAGKSTEVTETIKTNYLNKVILGAVLGIMAGGIIALLIDILDRKVHAISYINTIFDKEVFVYNATNNEKNEIETRLDIYLAQANNRLLVLHENENQLVNEWIQKHEQEVMQSNRLDQKNIEFADEAIIIINKDQTTINWLKNQYELLEDLGKNTYLIFMSKNETK